MKTYPIVDLTGDSYLNPVGAAYGDGSGTHQRAVGNIKSISIHHDASQRPHDYDSVARYRQEAAGHYNRLGPGLQYHFKIDNTGTIFRIRPLTTWLYVVGSAENVSTIAICLDGYFHPPYNEKPTREQYEALGQLLTNLCEQHPEFPATWPDVRPHRDFSATACPGDGLAPWVYAINSKADALNVPKDAVYDWPSMQPSNPTPPQTDTRPDWEKNFVALDTKKWTKGQATVIDLTAGKTISTVAENTQIDIGGKTSVAGTDFFISKYWTSRNVYSKAIPAVQLGDTQKPPVTPPVPTTPPSSGDQGEHSTSDLEKRVGVLEALLKAVVDFLDKIFKNWRS